jgi:release factor glutamine methyltransferase
MFISSNKLSELKKYFYFKLENNFSSSETNLMFQILCEKRLKLSRTDLLLGENFLLSESDLLYFKNVLNQLLENQPFQYIIGETLFADLIIKCDSRALIPRPETEELIFEIKSHFEEKKVIHFLDLCTGSGCIALALKYIFPDSKALALEFSREALNLAKENSLELNLPIDFIEADVLNDELKSIEDHSLDFMVSNPPYIPENDKKSMHENVLENEPHLALFVEDDNPYIFYEKICAIAVNKLKRGGKLFFEIHENFAKEISQILINFGFENISVVKDMQNKNRIVLATFP